MDDLNKERMDRCIPVAKEVLNIIASSDCKLGELTDEEKKDYEVVAKKVLELLLDKNILFAERHLVFQLVMQAVELSKDKVINSLDESFNLMMKVLATKDIMDLQLSDIHGIITSSVDTKPVEEVIEPTTETQA